MRPASPCLLVLALAAGLAASESESRFEAVRALIEAEARAPAERQLADFAAAGYADAGWYRRFLEWDFAERFHTVPPERAEAMAAEISAALEKDQSLPRAVREAFAARGSALLRAINELLRVLDPDAPPTLAARDLPPEERAFRAQLAARVAALAEAEWKRAAAEVAAFEANEEPAQWNLPPNDPKAKALLVKGAMLREQAARPLALAHIVLREVVTRGVDFGIDPAPTQAFFKAILTQAKDRLAAWDYASGDDYLPLKAACNALLGEAVREKVAGVSGDDVAGELDKLIDADLHPFPDAVRGKLVELQLATAASLMRWRLELGDERDLKLGLETWQALQDRMKTQHLALAGGDAKSRSLAQASIIAARIQSALRDAGAASATLAAVVAAHDNPLGQRARLWMARSSATEPSAEWADPPRPADPGESLTMAKVLVGQARATADVRWQRTLYLRAAIGLRNGLLGLGADADPERFVALAPEVYATYASVLKRLGLLEHAAIAAEQGLRAVAARVSAKSHPWHVDGDPAKAWTPAGANVQRLAQTALTDAAALVSNAQSAGAQGTAVQTFYADVVALTLRVDPEDHTDNLEKIRIRALMNAGDDTGAIPVILALAAKSQDRPVDAAWCFARLCEARTAAYDALATRLPTDPSVAAAMAEQARELLAACAAEAAPLTAALKEGRELTSIERATFAIARTGPIAMALRQGHDAEVITALEGDLWSTPLGDQALTGSMLKTLCIALRRQQEAMLPTADAAALLAAWPTQRRACDLLREQGAALTEEAATRSLRQAQQALAMVCNDLVNVGTKLRNQHGARSEELPLAEARRILVDLVYPDLTAASKPELLRSIGGLLWTGGDHARGGRLYEWCLQASRNDERLRSFLMDPRARLAEVEAVAAARPELKAEWAAIRALWSDEHPGVDYAKAALQLRAFRAKLESERTLIGVSGLATMVGALAPLQETIESLAHRLEVERALAAWYRESGRGAEARALYQELIAAQPDDDEIAIGFVDCVVAGAHEPGVPEAQLRQAREIAIRIRGESGTDPRVFWTAQIQALELSAVLHEVDSVDRALKALRLRGDLSEDLVRPPVRADARITGDDRRAHVAKDDEAVALARRYLALHRLQGVQQPEPFRIQEVTVAGRAWTLFVAADAPDMVGNEVANADGDPVVVFRPAGDSALK
jgi:hypothetical protein